MISTFNERLGVWAAREEMRLPTEAETKDRSKELLFFGAAIFLFGLALFTWIISNEISPALGAVMLIAPMSLLIGGIFARKIRLGKVKRRSKVLISLSNIESANG